MVSTVISVLFGLIILFPFIITFLTLFIYRRMGRAPISVLGEAADLTTPFLFLSTYIVGRTIFEEGVGFYMMIIFVVITILYAIYERVKVKEFRITRLLRKIWRLLFLVLVIVYILLIIVGLILKIIDYAG